MVIVEARNMFEEQISELEKQELRGEMTGEAYCQLLVCYLVVDDVRNAQLLWQRMPTAKKESDPVFTDLWTIGKCLTVKDTIGAYGAMKKRDWPESLKPLVGELLKQTRMRTMELVGKAYSAIRAINFATMMDMSVDEVVKLALSHKWTYDPPTQLIHPIKQERKPAGPGLPEEQHLEKMTDFVSFLEN